MTFVPYPDSEMLMMDLANRIAGELETALHGRDRATLAVPGGTTPGPLFDELSAADLDWSHVDVILTDERRVPPGHPRSNETLLRERLLVGRASAANFVRLVPEDEDFKNINERAIALLPISVLLLGMGEDMHTASLFPGAAQLDASLNKGAPSVLPVDASGALEPRITLTAPALRSAINTHVLIIGEAKKAAYETARHLTPDKAPIAVVLGDAIVHWAP